MLNKLLTGVFAFLFVLGSLPLPIEAAGGGMESEGIEEMLFSEIPTFVTASLSKRSLDKVPGTVSVIAKEQIKSHGFKYLIDVLHVIPGIRLAESSTGISINTRGFTAYGPELKLMIDGYSVNTKLARSISPYLRYPLNNVKQIEIIRGPGSSLYGTDAFCAVINIITDKTDRTTASVSGGELGNHEVNAAHYKKRGEDLSYSFTCDYMEENGDKITYETDFLTGTGMSYAPQTSKAGKKRVGATVSLGYKNLTIDASHLYQERDMVFGYLNTQSPDKFVEKDKYSFVGAKYLYDISEKSSLLFKTHYLLNPLDVGGQFLPSGFDWMNLLGIPDIDFDGTADNWPNGSHAETVFETQCFDFEALYQSFLGNHELSLGFQTSIEKYFDCETLTDIDVRSLYFRKVPYVKRAGSDPMASFTAAGKSSTQNGVFVQDVFDMTDKTTLIAGARYDNYSKAGDTFNPRMAVVWNTFADQTMKFSYATAFMAPAPNYRYTNIFGYTSNPDLRPATVNTIEMSIQNLIHQDFHYSIAFFYNEINDRIVAVVVGSDSMFYNSNRTDYVKGYEVEGRWSATDNLVFWGNYSFFKGYDNHNKSDYPGAKHIGNLGFVSSVNPYLKLSSFATFSGKHERDYTDRRDSIAGWAKIHASVVYTGIPNMEISLIGRNLFDKISYSQNDIPNILGLPNQDVPSEGRQIILQAGYRF